MKTKKAEQGAAGDGPRTLSVRGMASVLASPQLSFGVRRRANRHRNPQREVAAALLNRPDEDNAMSSGQQKDAGNTKRGQRQRPIRIIVGLFMLILGVPPLLNALGNSRIQALHVPDVLQLIASGLVFGFGLGLLLSKLMFRGG